MTSVERLRELMQACRAGKRMDEDLARWFGIRLSRFLDRVHPSLEEALELPTRHGGVPWWKEEQIRRRDAALRALAAALPNDWSISARAREINRLAVRYAGGAWRRDRLGDTMPSWYAGNEKEHIWQAFRAGAPMPLGERQLRNILCAG